MLSRRTRADEGGEFGLLLNVVMQDRAWREDLKGTGAPVGRGDLVPGTTVWAPSSTSETVSLGTRRRLGGSALLQWRPMPATEVYAELHAAELRTQQDSHQVNVSAGSGFVPGSVVLFDGTSDLRSITWTNAPMSLLSFARDTPDRTGQLSVGGRHDSERWSWGADLSHTKSSNRLFSSPRTDPCGDGGRVPPRPIRQCAVHRRRRHRPAQSSQSARHRAGLPRSPVRGLALCDAGGWPLAGRGRHARKPGDRLAAR